MPSTSGTVEVSTGRLVLREPPLTDDELDCWKYQVGQKGGVVVLGNAGHKPKLKAHVL